MTWTDPETGWVDEQLVEAVDMNAIGANLLWLKQNLVWANHDSSVTLSSTSYVTIHANLELTVVRYGAPLLFALSSTIISDNVLNKIEFKVQRDGTTDVKAGGYRQWTAAVSGDIEPLTFFVIIDDDQTGSHTYRWMYDNTGTGNPNAASWAVFAMELGV